MLAQAVAFCPFLSTSMMAILKKYNTLAGDTLPISILAKKIDRRL